MEASRAILSPAERGACDHCRPLKRAAGAGGGVGCSACAGRAGEVEAALKQAERVRRTALAAEDVAVLEQVLALARLIGERTDGKRHHEAGRLAYSARQNIRYVGRKQALAEGREWIDPFPPPSAALGAQPLSDTVGGKTDTAPLSREKAETAHHRGAQLVIHLGASFGFCAFMGLAGALEAQTLAFWFSWMAGWGVYWLVLAVLQVRWWRKGYDHFWRPVYSWVLTAFGAVVLSIPALLMFVLPLGELARGIVFLVVWLASLAAPLIVLRSRRWLFQQWRPYDPPQPQS